MAVGASVEGIVRRANANEISDRILLPVDARSWHTSSYGYSYQSCQCQRNPGAVSLKNLISVFLHILEFLPLVHYCYYITAKQRHLD